jgi:Tol biopolymer transport system component
MKNRIVLMVGWLILMSWLAGCLAASETPPLPTLQLTPITPTSEPTASTTPTPLSPTATPTSKPPTNTPISRVPAATDTPLPPTNTRAPITPSQPEPLQGLIVFPVFDPQVETYNIFAAKADGSDRKLVITEASQPALNPNGQRIAYRSWKADNRGLFERGIEGGDSWRFDAFFEAARPAFSPDGQAILFQSREAGEKFAIYRTVGADYEVLRREAFPIQGEAPAWSADGNSLVYKGCLGNDCGLIKINLDGSVPQQLTQDLSDTNPAVSPDGDVIVFMAQTSGSWDVYIVGVDGSDRRQLTTDPANDGLPAWSPDGKMIAFVSDRNGVWGVWAMAPDGSNQRLLFELVGSIDGVVKVDARNSRGWLEERIDWAP